MLTKLKSTYDYHLNKLCKVYYKNPWWVWGGRPPIIAWHHEACRVTSGDREGRIFLSHPHTNNGLFFLLNTKHAKYLVLYWKNMKRLPENPEVAEMRHGDVILTSQWRCSHGSTCGRHAAVLFYLPHGLVRVWEINRIHHWCSVGTEKSQPEGQPFQWDFSGTTEHQWSILFLIYHDRTVRYCVIFVGDVTEIDVYSQWHALYKSTWNSD